MQSHSGLSEALPCWQSFDGVAFASPIVAGLSSSEPHPAAKPTVARTANAASVEVLAGMATSLVH